MSLGRMSASFLRQPRRVLMTGVITMAAAAGAGTAAHAQQAEPLRNVVQLSASGSVEVDQDWLQMQLSAVREGSSAAVVPAASGAGSGHAGTQRQLRRVPTPG